jgi:hypothetical protein
MEMVFEKVLEALAPSSQQFLAVGHKGVEFNGGRNF